MGDPDDPPVEGLVTVAQAIGKVRTKRDLLRLESHPRHDSHDLPHPARHEAARVGAEEPPTPTRSGRSSRDIMPK